jgi:hypothetical protein
MFQGGSYGTYLIWLLNMLFTNQQLYDPFIKTTGSSHNIKNLKHIVNVDEWLKNPWTPDDCVFVKVHPKQEGPHSLLNNAICLTNYFGKSILVYPSTDTYLLNANNYVYKIWDDLWDGPLKYINKDNFYENFPIDRNTKLSDAPQWMIREWLSYNFFNSLNSQIEWFLPDTFSHHNCLVLFIDDILYDTSNMLLKVQNFLDLPFEKNIEQILPYHNKNIKAQKFLHQDKLAQTIITAVQDKNNHVTWKSTDLSLITESYIQQWLRNNNYDFKCNNLNKFPTSTEDLLKLL